MQLKLRRSQRDGGVLSKTVIFCLDARVELSPQEQQSVTRYKLQNQVIYNSEASRKHIEKGMMAAATGNMVGSLKSLASFALASMNLNISIKSLQEGQHIECKSLDELLGAEAAITEACENLKGYLDTAATFDGREVLVDYQTGVGQVVAQSATPAPMLIAASAAALPAPAQEAALFAAPRTVTAPDGLPGSWTDGDKKLLMWIAIPPIVILVVWGLFTVVAA